MFGIGIPELILILIIGLVVFGPGKLPDVGRAVGKSLNEFKKATSGIVDDKPVNMAPVEKKSEDVKVASAETEKNKPEIK